MTEAPEAHAPSGPSPNEPNDSRSLEKGPEAAGAVAAHESQAPSNDDGRETAPSDVDSSRGDVTSGAAPAEVAGSDVASDDAPAGEAGAGEHEQPATEGGEAAAAEGAPAGEGAGKRKRRRRKKGKAKTEAGEQEAAATPEQAEARRKRESSAAPFLRFFVGPNAGRKHGFAVEEAVAGRVKEVADGVITIDLFGKAIAYADEHEPREVPVREQPAEPTAEAATEPESTGAEPAAEAAEVADGAPAAAESAAAESAASEAAPTSEAPLASESAPASEAPLASESAPASEAPLAGEAAPASEAAEQAVEAPAEPSLDAVAPDAAHTIEAAPEQAAAEAAVAADASEDELDGEGETTLSGEASPAGHGPLPPAPVVPESFPRLEPVSVGQVFRGRVGSVSESGHIAIVNRFVQRKAVIANLEQYRTQRRRVQGLVYGFNRGGFDVLVEGARAFCPASAMALEDIDDPTQYLGKKLEFLLPASQAVTKDIIVSRRSILERQQRKKARELVRSLEPGQKLKGRVTQVREFGLFVDIGGVEGLVHQSELSFAHGVRPADVAKPGDEVEVQVLRVGAEPNKREGGKRDRAPRVSLSMKALQPDPWDAHAEALREGSAQLGRVTRTTDFGAFVEVAPQIEGLLHITELGRDLKHANQAVKEGDEIQVVIERVDRRARRISLSKLSQQELEELQAGALGEEAQRNVKPGSRIKVKVARVEPRGLVVRIAGVLGKRARGYIPAIELPGGRGGDLRKAYPVGSELEVKVVGIDRDGGLRCSPKALAIDEERKAVKDYRREASKQGFGTFGDLLRAKLGQADPKQ